jgi:hypothetical protein
MHDMEYVGQRTAQDVVPDTKGCARAELALSFLPKQVGVLGVLRWQWQLW